MNACLPGCVWNATPRSLSPLQRNIGFWTSVRGSDPDAALYWLHRMLQGGEDPRFILRRLMRMSMEDIGLADPNALLLATSAREAVEQVVAAG